MADGEPSPNRQADDRPCRIWIFNHYASAPNQPSGTRHYSLARAVVRGGGQATIFASAFGHGRSGRRRSDSRGPVRREVFDGVTFVWLKTFPYRGNDWRRMANMASYAVVVVLAQFGRPAPDVVVGSTVHPFAALAAWVVAKLRRARFIYEVRDLWPQTLIDLGAMRPTGLGARLLYAIEAFLVRRAEVVITLLPGIATYLGERGLPADHVRYLPNGFDLAEARRAGRIPGGTETAVDALIAEVEDQRRSGEVIFIYLGAHARVNSLSVVLRAWAHAVPATPVPMRLLMVGDGPEKPMLEEQAAELGLTRVTFRDPVAKSRVQDLLAAVDVGIVHTTYTPVYRYGVSFNKLFDYMAARLPIAFATSTAADPVEASGSGLTIPPDDPEALGRAFVTLAEMDPAGRRQMGEAGRAYLEREHDLGRIGDAFAEIAGCQTPSGGVASQNVPDR